MKRPVILVLALFLLVVSFAAAAGAELVTKFTIHSEYQSPIPGLSVNIIIWDYEVSRQGDAGSIAIVYDQKQKVGCRAELYFAENRALRQADCYRLLRGEEVCSASQFALEKPALLSSTIIPGDWLNRPLPFSYVCEKSDYSVYEQIGSARFVAHLQVDDKPIRVSEARSAGMLREDLQDSLSGSENLYLVAVKRVGGDGSEELLLEQLWLEGDSFWLYEAKGGRRSWRVLEK